MTYSRPGVYVQETLLTPQPAAAVAGRASAVFIGANPRGPVDRPAFCRSWSDYTRRFGGFEGVPGDLPFALYSYFQNGGRDAYVVRAVGAGAAASGRVLQDTGGTPDDTLRVNAIDPGTWGNSLSFDIVAGQLAGRFDLVVKYTTAEGTSTVETWTDLSMGKTDTRYAVDVVNAGSTYVVLTDMDSSTAAPNNAPAPVTNRTLLGGNDGGSLGDTHYATAQATLDTIDTTLIANLPGVTTTSVINQFLLYAENRGDIFLVIDTVEGNTAAQMVTAADAYTASSYAAVYGPRVVVQDPSSRVQGATRLIPVGGAVVGIMSQTDATRGVFKAPAGLEARVDGAVNVERRFTNAELDLLNTAAAPVNAIRQLPGAGIVVYGAKTLKPGRADKYVPVRRTLMHIRKEAINLTRFAVFEPNDPDLWAEIRSVLTNFLQELYQQGGLRGASPSQAYYVKCDGSINGTAQIQNGEVRVEIGVSLQYPAEFIVISLGQFEGGVTASESA